MRTVLSFLLCIFSLHGFAQVNFTSMPLRMQVVPRNLITNEGHLIISGDAAESSNYDAIVVYKYRNTELQKVYTRSLAYSQEYAHFNFDIPIQAEMTNYAVVIFGKTGSSLKKLAGADSLLAGDAFIIQGQSNAHASRALNPGNPENQNSFIRTWGSTGSTEPNDTPHYQKKWFIADGDIRCYCKGNVGQWGLRLAKQLLDAHKIPIVIYNEANSGYPIILLGRNDDKPYDQNTTYGRCLQRVTESGFKNDIHGIFWYQGESDAGNSLEYYKRSFRKLHRDWQRDYKDFTYTYIMQIKQGCGGGEEDINIIQEALRQLAMELDNTTIVSTNSLSHQNDECHYAYYNGYRKVGNYLFPLVERNQYQQPNYPNIESPRVKKIVLTAPDKLTLYLKNENDDYIWEPGTENDFVVYEDTTIKIMSGELKKSTVILTANKNISEFATLSFKGHRTGGSPCLTTINGPGLVGFYKYPVIRRPETESKDEIINSAPSVFRTLSLYPNPAKNGLTIQYKLDKPSQVLISIYNDEGQKKWEYNAGMQSAGYGQTPINISSLVNGIYMLKLQAEGVQFSGKFIKE